MKNNMLSESEMAFARIIWEKEPLRSGELVRLCEEKFGWKKSTTYTVLKNLCNVGIFKNENAVVTSLVNEEKYLENESTQIVNERFDGSISKFVTAFTGRKKLNKKQIDELKKIIEDNS
ncbi:MAG: BlaI/MecI/CopY family transcriptional regulator [Roseburia sp.]|nr:BlaI/MecI/CopY family transcriptional regulator [Roseburia sp.]